MFWPTNVINITMETPPSTIEKGRACELRIEVSEECKHWFKRTLTEIDTDMTYEDAIHAFIHAYQEEPALLERIHDYGRTF